MTWEGRRLPNDKRRRKHKPPWASVPTQVLKQQPCGGPADLVARDADRREWRVETIGEGHVVEADDRDVPGD